jgi:hypothetical protein
MVAIAPRAEATSIYVIDTGLTAYPSIASAKSDLTNLGYGLTTGGTLADYSGYDEVWDLRFNATLGTADVAAMGSYLAGGGRMYLTGENAGYDFRNNSVLSLLNAVGAGSLTLSQGYFTGVQAVTTAGQIVNNPNAFSQVAYQASRTTTSAGSGFFVTEKSPGEGSLVGWDFGDIAGSPDARLLVGFDIEIFTNGTNWTQNMATYLGAPAPAAPVPEPASIVLLGTGVAAVARRRLGRRRPIGVSGSRPQ